MGRKKKYLTDKEKLDAKRETRMRYYWNHVEKEKEKSLLRYYKNKELNDNIQNNKLG